MIFYISIYIFSPFTDLQKYFILHCIIHSLLGYSRTEVNIRYKMLPKAVQLAQYTLLTEAGTARPAKTQGDTSIAKSSDQLVE